MVLIRTGADNKTNAQRAAAIADAHAAVSVGECKGRIEEGLSSSLRAYLYLEPSSLYHLVIITQSSPRVRNRYSQVGTPRAMREDLR